VATDLTQTLSELGFITVGPVADGEAALKLARLAMPDMALLDIRMPKLDGLSAARAMFEELGVPAVIVSAYSDGEYVEAAAVAGVFGYIIKPAMGDQLRVTLAVAWSRFRQHAAQREEAQALRRKLDDRKTIEQAKWILVSRKNITEPSAQDAAGQGRASRARRWRTCARRSRRTRCSESVPARTTEAGARGDDLIVCCTPRLWRS
jgi:response regulator NasT